MDFAIEILQHNSTAWSRWLIFLAVVLTYWSIRFYGRWKKQKDEIETMQKLHTALEIKKLLLEIELMELELGFHTSDLVNIPRIQIQKDYEKAVSSITTPNLSWNDKMIYGLMGSFFFLLLIILFYLINNLDELQKAPYTYVSFTKELVISAVCGVGVALIPGTQRWDYFFYGFCLPVLLGFLMVELKT